MHLIVGAMHGCSAGNTLGSFVKSISIMTLFLTTKCNHLYNIIFNSVSSAASTDANDVLRESLHYYAYTMCAYTQPVIYEKFFKAFFKLFLSSHLML